MKKELLSRLTKEDILRLNPRNCMWKMDRTDLELIFMACGAFWHHPGQKKLKAPHAILTSGKHSNLYVNCPQVLQRSNLCQIMAQQLVYLLQTHYAGPIDWVTGSDSSALGLSKDFANLVNAKWHPMQKGSEKTQLWEKAIIKSGEWVLDVEELLTTGLTAQAVYNGIKKGNPNQVNFVPFVPLLVYRPDKDALKNIDGSQLIWLLRYDAYVVDPNKEECVLCKNGSPALSAKENWDQLVATM